MTDIQNEIPRDDTVKIEALIKQLYDLCSNNEVPLMIALQENTGDGRKCIRLVTDERYPVSPQMRLVKTLIQKPDIDDFLRILMLDAKKNGHRSLVLRAMGIPEEPNT